MNSVDEIIELYKRDVDRSLIDACLERSVEERLRALEEFEEFREELKAAHGSPPNTPPHIRRR